jgi:hypothetical protein
MKFTARVSCEFALLRLLPIHFHLCTNILEFSIVAMVSLAFGIVGIIACALCKDVDSKMTNKVPTIPSPSSLHHRSNHIPLPYRSKYTSRTPLSPTETNTTKDDTPVSSTLSYFGQRFSIYSLHIPKALSCLEEIPIRTHTSFVKYIPT